ncbi:hypothetical protein [Actinoplanes sp. URMC 104]|uniref:hypothetical protein n=1 Tax=Actinoplanes sp. URMC 104 TaxID=3423409 RepID=UPI003F1E0581
MSHRMIRTALSATLVAGSAAFILSSPGPARAADLVTGLPIASFGDIVVNGASKRIFISDPSGGKLVTTDYAGKVTNTVDKLPGIAGLALADDGDVYAAVPGLNAIVAFSENGGRLETYPAGGAERPLAVAQAGGGIWFGAGNGKLGRLDRSGDEPTLRPGVVDVSFSTGPAFAASGNLLVATDTSVKPATFTVVDVSTTPPTKVVTRQLGADRPQDLAFTADGSRLVTAGLGSPARAVKPADLSTIENYTAGPDGNAVAVRADGTVAVGRPGTAAKAVSLFTPGKAAATRQYDLRNAGTLLPGGLAWEPGGPRLFGVSDETVAGTPEKFALQIFGDPSRTTTTVALSVPAKLALGATATITGVFASPVPAGLPVVITRKDAAGSRRVGPTTVPAGGRFTISDKPAKGGTVTYTVAFAGNDDFSPATVTKSFAVGTAGTTTLSLDRNGGVFAYGSTVTLTAKLGATHSSRTVEIWADPFGSDQPSKLVRRAAVNSKGVLTASYKLTRNTTFSAIFRGDAFTAARAAKSTVSTKVNVWVAIDKHYGTAVVGGVTYHVIRSSVDPSFFTHMPQYPGRKPYLTIDFFNGSKWQTWRASYSVLQNGVSENILTGTHTIGVRYRVRSAYLYGKSGDTVNTTTYGNYKYFTFSR